MSISASTHANQFDVVLFDVGGVFLTNGWDHVERATVLDHFQLDRAAFEARHANANDAWENDTLSDEAYLDATIFYEPRSFTRDAFIAEMKLESKLLPDNAVGVLREIAASGKWMVGLLNNESRLLHEYRMEKFELLPYLKVQLSSCYLGMRKPDPAIYRRAIDIVGRPAKRILFIDDRATNTEAAAASGMTAIQFIGEEQLRHDLRKLEIL
ncbi:HAD-IA family hydrolase [Acidicapsa ligni]|uniref:HAD-IA family hydrolase n=1 Tax=Acidicapsa ligni TaxID=542300 RepID=UPI0021DF5E84|nr:HAD-IA family hydrolase [Acidicapsa ligni]